MTESVLSWQKAGLCDCLGTYRIRRMLKRNSKQQGTGSVRLSTVGEPLDLESLHRSKCILSTCYAIPDCRVVMTPGTWYLWSKKFALVQRIRQPFVCSTKNILYHSVVGRLRVSRSTNGFFRWVCIRGNEMSLVLSLHQRLCIFLWKKLHMLEKCIRGLQEKLWEGGLQSPLATISKEQFASALARASPPEATGF